MSFTAPSVGPFEVSSSVLSAPCALLDEDRRVAPRVPRRVEATLCAMGDADPLCCITEDISEGGICVHVPAPSVPRIGQRFGVTLCDSEHCTAQFDAGYATVVRTTRVAGADNRVLIGLRFDQPVYF